jgi:hypothetical protein
VEFTIHLGGIAAGVSIARTRAGMGVGWVTVSAAILLMAKDFGGVARLLAGAGGCVAGLEFVIAH